MKKALLLAALALTGMIGHAQDATAVLREADRALGASSLKSMRYSGTGFAYNFLQNWRPDAPYPKFYAKYARTIDFDKRISREELTRSQFENPPHGGGQQPLYTDTTQAAVTGDNSAWGGGSVLLTPQGFIRAALAAQPTVTQTRVGGKTMDVVSFTAGGKYKVTGYINALHLVERLKRGRRSRRSATCPSKPRSATTATSTA